MYQASLKISSEHLYDEETRDKITSIVDAKIAMRDGNLYISYVEEAITQDGEEVPIEDNVDIQTTIKISSGSVKITKSGENVPVRRLEFSLDKPYESLMYTPMGNFTMMVFTKHLENTLDAFGNGSLHLEYDTRLNGLHTNSSKLKISYLEER
ncbi:MAG: DUF1934 domain-containing protein [Eubacteriales bacterium]|nr:DUF1934 domain-containing protein [Eubacteriales bacterium]MDY3332541.1 DUF1934 domain-containing protein [Gallibacter sp.]